MSKDESEVKKESILLQATKLFARCGFGGVSIRQIAEESGCNLAAISYYFGGKEKLYSECIKTLGEDEIIRVTTILCVPRNRTDFENKLCQFVSSFCNLLERHSKVIRILINELNSHESYSPNLENTVFGPVSEAIQKFFLEAKAANIVRKETNVVLIGRIFLSLTISEVIYVKADKKSYEEFSKELILNCIGSIYA